VGDVESCRRMRFGGRAMPSAVVEARSAFADVGDEESEPYGLAALMITAAPVASVAVAEAEEESSDLAQTPDFED
jgi:hypothetical protein